MVFSSIIFLWVFLPLILISYYVISLIPFKKLIVKRRVQNTILLVFSLLFYAYGGVKYLFLMLAVIYINYLGGYLVANTNWTDTIRKRLLWVVIIVNIGILFYFKYFNFFIENVELVLNKPKGSIGLAEVVLPIGISFYIFQALSYVVDVYRKNAKLQTNLLDFALYISFFPQLIAGPIVQYSDVENQIRKRKETEKAFAEGIKKFLYGLAKKVIIANTMAEIADEIWASDLTTIGASIAWLGALAYTFQIYYDFSGYSDMAIGLGRMFGFKFKENFDYPYISKSVQEFWRRWHMSLSSWFKNYVYIPLGGSRCSNVKIYRNIFIVFLLTGIWHGANWTFVIWGLLQAVFLMLERAFLGKLLNKNPIKIFNWLYTMIVAVVGWIFFRSDDVSQAIIYIGQLFANGASDYSVFSYISGRKIIVFILAILCGGILVKPINFIKNKYKSSRLMSVFSIVAPITLFILSIIILLNGSYNPFIYYQF